jgi:hypothetical protein
VTATDDYKLCNTELPSGCGRCTPRTSHICCDLCHPNFFRKYLPDFEKQSRSAVKSNVKSFGMLPADHALKAALVRWRRETSLQKLGTAVVRTYGAKVFISDQIIERLVVCAHAHKLAGVDDIVKETGWRKDRAEEYGDALLKIIHAHTPLPVPPSTAPPTGADNTSRAAQVIPDAGLTTRKRRPAKCSKCHQEGHISMYPHSLLAGRACLSVASKVQISHVLQELRVGHMMITHVSPLPTRTQHHMAARTLRGLLCRHDLNPGHIIAVHKRSQPHMFRTTSQVLQMSYRLRVATIMPSRTLLHLQLHPRPPHHPINGCARSQDHRRLLLLHPLMHPSLHRLPNRQISFSPS